MKKIVFVGAENNATSDYPLIYLRDNISAFLTKNGMTGSTARECVSTKVDGIVFSLSCANSDYTRAFALLQLIFSSENAPAFFEYRSSGIYLTIRATGFDSIKNKATEASEFLKQHSEIEIVE